MLLTLLIISILINQKIITMYSYNGLGAKICFINISRLYFFCFLLLLSGCRKIFNNEEPDATANQSVARQLQGEYSGSAERLPERVNLTTETTCKTVEFLHLMQRGNCKLIVAEVDDTTVNLVFTSPAFAAVYYEKVSLSKSGNNIIFYGSSSYPGGVYNIQTQRLTFSAIAASVIYHGECRIEYPKVQGMLGIFSNVYGYQTIGYLDFIGTKD